MNDQYIRTKNRYTTLRYQLKKALAKGEKSSRIAGITERLTFAELEWRNAQTKRRRGEI